MKTLLALALLAALMTATGLTVFSDAAFTATSKNDPNQFSAGGLSITNSKDDAAIFSGNLRPGISRNGTLTITNSGSHTAAFTLRRATLTNSPGATPLAPVVDLRVEDITGTAVTRYNGKLSAFTNTVALGNFTAGQTRTFRVTVTMPATPVNPDLQGESSAFTLRWEAS